MRPVLDDPRSTYSVTLKLKHNERPIAVDEHGEAREFRTNRSLPEGHSFPSDQLFIKRYQVTDNILLEELTGSEYMLLAKLLRHIEPYTNHIKILDFKTSQRFFGQLLGVDHKTAGRFKKKMEKLGVIGYWEVFEISEDRMVKRVVVNPKVAFQGKFVRTDILNLFSDTWLNRELTRRQSTS